MKEEKTVGIFGLAVMTVFPSTAVEDDDALVEVGQRTRAAWDNRMEFFDAKVLLGPRMSRIDTVTMRNPRYAGRDWMALRMSGCVRADDWGEQDRTYLEVMEA